MQAMDDCVAPVCQHMMAIRGGLESEQLLRPVHVEVAWSASFIPDAVDQPLQAISCLHVRVWPCYWATVRGITRGSG